MQNHPNSACHFAVFKSARPKVQEVDRDDLFCLDMIEKPLQIRQQSFSESNQMSPLMAITLGFGPEKVKITN